MRGAMQKLYPIPLALEQGFRLAIERHKHVTVQPQSLVTDDADGTLLAVIAHHGTHQPAAVASCISSSEMRLELRRPVCR